MADLNKTADFCTTVFGGEIESVAPREGRSFKFGDCVLRLIPRAAVTVMLAGCGGLPAAGGTAHGIRVVAAENVRDARRCHR